MRRIIGFSLICIFIFSFIWMNNYAEINAEGETVGVTTIILIFGALSGLIFWIWMLTDLFYRRGIKYKWVWGWLMIFINIPVSVVYFLIYMKNSDSD